MKPRILMIGRDPSIFSDNPVGDLHDRMKYYSSYHEYVYMTSLCNQHPITKQEDNVEYIGLSHNPILFLWEGFWELKKLSFHILNTQDPFLTGFLGWILKKYFWLFEKKSIPLVIDLHSEMIDNPVWIEERWYNWILNIIGKELLKRADAVRTVSPKLLSDMLKLSIPPHKVFFIPVGTNIQIKESVVKSIRSDNTILFVGRLVPQKNVQLLIKAFATLIDEGYQYQLRIVGEGPEEENLENLCQQLEVQNEVSFLGRLNENDLNREYDTATCLVLPSKHEGWGLVVIEAMAHGIPVVVSNAVRRVNPIISENTAMVSGDYEDALVDAILNVLIPENKEATEIRVNNAKKAIKEYDITKTSEMKGRMFELIAGEMNG